MRRGGGLPYLLCEHAFEELTGTRTETHTHTESVLEDVFKQNRHSFANDHYVTAWLLVNIQDSVAEHVPSLCLYCTMPYYAIPYYTIPFHTMLYHTILEYTIIRPNSP